MCVQLGTHRRAVGSPLSWAHLRDCCWVSEMVPVQGLVAVSCEGPTVSVSFSPWATGAVCCPAVVAQEHGRVAVCQQDFPYREGCRGPYRALPHSGRGGAEHTVGAR